MVIGIILVLAEVAVLGLVPARFPLRLLLPRFRRSLDRLFRSLTRLLVLGPALGRLGPGNAVPHVVVSSFVRELSLDGLLNRVPINNYKCFGVYIE